jgi:curved DNA-binding protein CbpA
MTASSQPDPYAILGVSATVSADDLDHAFRGLVRRHHPDTRTPDAAAPDADRRLQEILAAYATLRDPVRRAAYDRLRIGPATAAQASTERVTAPKHRTEPAIRVGPVRWRPFPRDAPPR